MIQHYIREGLVPQPLKLATNSALYGEAHVERLALITRAKRLLGHRPPVAQLRRVVELIEQGVEPEVAVMLQRAVWAQAPVEADESEISLSARELATELGVSRRRVEALVDAGVLIPAPRRGGPRFDAMDLRLARMYVNLADTIEIDLELLAEVARLVQRISAIEMKVRNRAVSGRSAHEAAAASAELQALGNAWHPYARFRARQWDIAREGLGPVGSAP